MNLAALSIEKRAIAYFGILLILAGGTFCYFQLGQLEDPEFSVKTAVITTTYPGASAEQVELEITDRIETKLQEMVELKNVYSNSRPGLSIIKVDIKSNYWSDRLPQVWDVLRKKVADVEPTLPPGAGKPKVGDDFGYVFGFLLAVSSDGYSYAELERCVKDMRKELSVVPGVARVDLWGVQEKRIYIDVSTSQLAELGLTAEQMMQTLQSQNLVVDAGRVDYLTQRIRVAPTGEFQSPEDIGDLAIASAGAQRDELLRVRDFATVSFGYADPPGQLLRHNGRQAIALALAPGAGENVVQVGQAIDRRIAELVADLPVGIGVDRISWQSDQVSESIRAFMISLLEAVAIVLALLALTMGLRAGVIIGISGLVFPILGTFIVMAIMGIDLHRISLGAMIIAMGMMVDNAIVVTDGIMVRIAQGMDRKQAAIEAASGPAWPLLGATVVACMAFYPIFASSYDTGEYAGSLFTVVAISLLLSWVFCETIAPLLCIALLPSPKPGQAVADPYQGAFYLRFRQLLSLAIRYRALFLASMVGLLVVSVLGFRFVPQLYFPDSSRLQIMIDYWAPEGTRIQQTSADLEKIERFLQDHDAVASTSAFIGKGPPRFYLPVSAEDPYTSYAQLIVNTKTLAGVNQLLADTDAWVRTNVPEAMVRVRKYAVGAFDDWKIEARFSGPANADPATLRRLAEEGANILRESPYAKEVRTNWREKVLALAPLYDQERGRWARVSREDLARTTRRASDGVVVGQYRQEDDLIPIVARNTEEERRRARHLAGRTPDHARTIDARSPRFSGCRWNRRPLGKPDRLALGPAPGDHRPVRAQRGDRAYAPQRSAVKIRGDQAPARLPAGLGRRVLERQAVAGGAHARHRPGGGDHAVHPRRPVQRLPADVDLHPRHPVCDDRDHLGAADHRNAVRVHRPFGSDEPFRNDDQECRGAARRGECESIQGARSIRCCRRGRGDPLEPRRERRRHDRARRPADAPGRVLGGAGGDDLLRADRRHDAHDGRRPDTLCPFVPNFATISQETMRSRCSESAM